MSDTPIYDALTQRVQPTDMFADGGVVLPNRMPFVSADESRAIIGALPKVAKRLVTLGETTGSATIHYPKE
ncbi:hypothetical protein [Mycetocola saprophilus]|uniref:hypothetical protein n=1 Tax=Mycetocola saprophilus TaxID=76636 RepID=UPI0004BF79B3|nr:hypothetical protein [Mycetocola saprophilus]